MKRRMRDLFGKNGRTLIVAMDHAAFLNKPVGGLIHPDDTIRKVVAGGADVVMTTFGTARRFQEELSGCGLILTVPNSSRLVDQTVEAALSVGADGIKCLVYPWLDSDVDSVNNCHRLGIACDRWQMPLLAEVVPGGFAAGPEMRTPEVIAAGARIGAECGGDFIKTFYPGTPEKMQAVIDNCYVPVIILGGPKMDSDRDILQVVKDSTAGGSSGVAMGTNIWRHAHPENLVAAIASILHQDATVDEALEYLK
ncbi:MAG: deoxyribose-phosphate aldolase [Anaerolineae bacterium]|nr:deoxyribose-phosphate aldolase [Anaerolineae bacterium]